MFGQLFRIFPAKLRISFCQPSNRDTGRLPVHEKSSSAVQRVFVHALICLVAAVPPDGQKISRWAGRNRQTKGSKTNEIMATINENLKKQLAKKMYHFVKYFPVRIKNVGEDAIENRKLVWGFKDADREITLKVAQMTASYLLNEFGDRLKNIVFVCIPASTCEQNENRYRFFCEQVCSLAGVMNGFSHIRILSDRPSVHENRKKNTHADFSERLMKFDEDFFKEKDVLIYDDVVTTGMSYAELAERLEFLGANVLGGLFLSRTYYKYQ